MRASTLLFGFCVARLRLPLRADPVADHVQLQREQARHRLGRLLDQMVRARCSQDPQILGAAWISLKVAVVSATLAVVLGTLAAYVLTRFGRFRGRALLTGMSTAPLVMPDVITGLSLLLLFVVDGAADRLAGRARHDDDHHRAHHLLHGLCHGGRAVAARRHGREPRGGGDGPRRAGRCGSSSTSRCRSSRRRWSPGWLLAFTLSLDDLVVASFVTGPGASTLPMVIFSKVRLGVSPDINALATIIIAIVALGVFVASWQMRRARRAMDRTATAPSAPPGRASTGPR